ncbi:hypothetical protein SynRS9909_01864 [Synechococcus sp. RS9909]|nr:hypothetical protein SynRS9909_01864 [Synechococcus sp. RS9909]
MSEDPAFLAQPRHAHQVTPAQTAGRQAIRPRRCTAARGAP